jgi:hypothetical protein
MCYLLANCSLGYWFEGLLGSILRLGLRISTLIFFVLHETRWGTSCIKQTIQVDTWTTFSLISFSTWNITVSLSMMHSCGIGLNPHCLMMHYSLHHASTMHLVMKTSGPQLKKYPWVHICRNFLVVLGSLMALWLKSISHGKNEAHHTWFNGWKKNMEWTTWSLWTIMGCSFM